MYEVLFDEEELNVEEFIPEKPELLVQVKSLNIGDYCRPWYGGLYRKTGDRELQNVLNDEKYTYSPEFFVQPVLQVITPKLSTPRRYQNDPGSVFI